MGIPLHRVKHLSGPNTKTYVEFVAFVCLALFGIECAYMTIWYFIQQSENPYEVLKDAPVLTISLTTSLVVLGLVLFNPIRRSLANKGAKYGDQLPKVNSFIEFLKMPRIWGFVLIITIVIPLVMMITISPALNAPEGIARTAFDIVMAHFIGLGVILTLIGLGGMVYTVIK